MWRSDLRSASRGRRLGPSLEALERRDCPAVLAVTGSREVSEAVGSTTMTVTLSAPESAPVAVDYFLQGNATAGRDYRLAIGTRPLTTPMGTITFQPGETSKTVSVAVVNDADREQTESMVFTLFKPRNATLGSAQSATVTIRDDDNYTASIVGPSEITEGQAGEYQLRLSSPATKSETFYINTNITGGTALPGSDYRPITQLPLIFNPGDTVKTFRIQTLNDTVAEYDEYFFLRATPASPGFPAVPAGSITIPGPLGPAPLPQLTIANASAPEGNSGSSPLTFTLTLAAAYRLPVSVSYVTADGTATAASGDYQAASGVVTIPAGETSATITVNALGDTTQEPNETFTIVLSNPVNASLTSTTTATGTIVDDDTAFQIVVTFPDNTLSASQKLVFQQAAARWSQIIVGDLPDVTVNGRVIDDLEITATGPSIDGPGGILGQAGPTAFRKTGSKLPYQGQMEFDSADIAMMQSDGTFFSVILHEMCHVLGLGTLWQSKNLVTGLDTNDPLFIGANALKEYRQLAGDPTAPGVPVENGGGSGTRGGHWRESVFKTELMTGYAEAAGVPMPISRMTVGSLQDLGYVVNYAKADPYTLPGIQAPGIGAATTGWSTSKLLALSALPDSTLLATFAQGALDAAAPAKQRAFAAIGRG